MGQTSIPSEDGPATYVHISTQVNGSPEFAGYRRSRTRKFHRRTGVLSGQTIDRPIPPTGRAGTGRAWQTGRMCRNIRVLSNFEPPATPDEVEAAAIQYVRKVSGSARPSAANQAAFDAAIAAVSAATTILLDALVTHQPPRDREVEAIKAKARAAERYGRTG
jgi:hypothetical protein